MNTHHNRQTSASAAENQTSPLPGRGLIGLAGRAAGERAGAGDGTPMKKGEKAHKRGPRLHEKHRKPGVGALACPVFSVAYKMPIGCFPGLLVQ
jgi:hypothetical protein